ncbi:MAG: SdrD B-like domain-containing protein [candidate division Zixibacteria bacterium]
MRTIFKLIATLSFFSLALVSCQDGSVLTSPDSAQSGSLSNLTVILSAVGDYVWLDENMNGIQDDGEGGLSDIEVTLYDCQEDIYASTTTDEEGHYVFDGLEMGEYMLGFEAPDGYQFSPQDEGDDEVDSDVDPETGLTECFELEADSENLSWDAGLFMSADDDCTYGKGFWKNHCGFGPQDDLVSDLLPIRLGDEGEYSINVETTEMAYDILGQHSYGQPSNGITRLYAHFLTAKLNIANGASDEDIADLIEEVDDFLADNDYESWGELGEEDRQAINDWKGTLEDYNEGEIGPGSCHDFMVN